jgi:hypothetical protein
MYTSLPTYFWILLLNIPASDSLCSLNHRLFASGRSRSLSASDLGSMASHGSTTERGSLVRANYITRIQGFHFRIRAR